MGRLPLQLCSVHTVGSEVTLVAVHLVLTFTEFAGALIIQRPAARHVANNSIIGWLHKCMRAVRWKKRGATDGTHLGSAVVVKGASWARLHIARHAAQRATVLADCKSGKRAGRLPQMTPPTSQASKSAVARYKMVTRMSIILYLTTN